MKIKFTAFLLSFLFSFGLCQGQVVKKGLVGYWPFNGNADDESINNNNGTVKGASLTTDRFGVKNAAYEFDGFGDYIDCGYSSNILISTNTTNFWFLYTDTTTAQNFVNNTNSENGEWGAVYYNHPTAGLVAGISGGSNDSWIAGVTKKNFRYADSSWHMFTSAYSAKDNSLSFYIDGKFISNITDQNKDFINGRDSLRHNGKEHWVFGVRSQFITSGTSTPGYLKGALDDVMLFNRVLTQSEITKLFNATSSIEKEANIINNSVSIYPNPVTSLISISIDPSQIDENYRLYNSYGQLVNQGYLQSQITEIAVNDLAGGIYFLQIGTSQQNSYKVIKK